MYVFIYLLQKYIYCPMKSGVFENTLSLVVIIKKLGKEEDIKEDDSSNYEDRLRPPFFSPIMRHMHD